MRMMDTVKTMFAALEREPVPTELELQDIAMARSDYDVIVKSPAGARERMVFMAERFGVGEAQLDRDHWRAVDMARSCANCGVVQSCDLFRLGKNTGFTPASCPNAPQFCELTV